MDMVSLLCGYFCGHQDNHEHLKVLAHTICVWFLSCVLSDVDSEVPGGLECHSTRAFGYLYMVSHLYVPSCMNWAHNILVI